MTDHQTGFEGVTWFNIQASDDERRSGELFHYTTAEALIGILGTGTLRASDSRFSNDVSEIQAGIDFIKQRMETLTESEDPAHRDTLNRLVKDYLDSWMDQLTPYLFCLS